MNKIAVLMSCYINDRPELVKLAVSSILNQSYKKFDLFIAFDGPVKSAVSKYLKSLKDNRIHLYVRKDNKGLAFTLNELIEHALTFGSYTYFARMDADDISKIDRFEKQLNYLTQNPDIDVLGSWCEEINENGKVIFFKRLPSSNAELKANIVKRNPFIHTSVMMKRSIFDHGVRYKTDMYLTEDLYLWVQLASKGLIFANIEEFLIQFRIDSNFYKRRGGIKKAFAELQSRLYIIRKLNINSVSNYFLAFTVSATRLLPHFISKLLYMKLR